MERPILTIIIVVMLLAGGVLLYPIFFPVPQQKTNSLLPGEIINVTVAVSASDLPQSVPLSYGPGTYEIHASTVSREDPGVAIGYDYEYWSNTSSTDRFGTTWDNKTVSNPWSIYWSDGIGTTGNLGYTDANTVVNDSFTIPGNAISSSILVIKCYPESKGSTVNIMVRLM